MKILKYLLALIAVGLVFAFNSEHGHADTVCELVSKSGDKISLATSPLLIQFSSQVERRKRPNNGFLKFCVDESDMVNGQEVRRPIEGDDPIAVTNPTQFPLEMEQREESTATYTISLHATKPQRVSDFTQLQSNYNLRQLVIDKHMAVIEHKIAREILYNWSPTNVNNNIVLTTGGSVEATLAKWGATGNRKAIEKNNYIDAIRKVKEDDAEDGTVMMIPVGHEAQMRKIGDFIDYQLTGRADMLANGIIGRIFGCNVMYRSTGIVYGASGLVPVKPTFVKTSNKIAVAANACQGVLIWNPTSVYKAIGKIEVYVDPKNGSLLGGSVNFSQPAGGNKRSDELGIAAIVEATP